MTVRSVAVAVALAALVAGCSDMPDLGPGDAAAARAAYPALVPLEGLLPGPAPAGDPAAGVAARAAALRARAARLLAQEF